MATFVQLSEEHIGVELGRLMTELLFTDEQKDKREAEMKTVSELVEKKQFTQLLDKLVFDVSDRVMALPAEDFHTVFNLVFLLLSELSKANQAAYLKKFSTLLSQNKQHKDIVVKLLGVLFNLTEQTLRLDIFTTLLEYCLATESCGALRGQLNAVPTWATEWKLDADQTSILYLLTSRVAAQGEPPATQRKFVSLYLQSLENASAGVLQAGKDPAAAACIAAIQKAEPTHLGKLLQYKAVQQLEKDAEHAATYKLLKIFAEEQTKAYTQFASANAAYLKKQGLDSDELLQHIRALTLCTLAAQQDELTFSVLKDALEIKSNDELEECVIGAVVAGLLEAKIDQTNQVIRVTRTQIRSFDQNSWKRLAVQLDQWNDNVDSVLNSLLPQQSHVQAS